jgi:hypothetical protein
MAETARLPALALIEPLHGLTFALLHLTCMRLLAGLPLPPGALELGRRIGCVPFVTAPADGGAV